MVKSTINVLASDWSVHAHSQRLVPPQPPSHDTPPVVGVVSEGVYLVRVLTGRFDDPCM